MAIESSIDIQAPIERVWDLTCDVERLPSLNPTFRSAIRLDDDQPLGVGSKIRLRQQLQPALVWTITEFKEPTLFEWSTRLLGTTMTATHNVEPIHGGCRNNLRVQLTGPASWILERIAGRLIRRAIITENQGFKAVAENHA